MPHCSTRAIWKAAIATAGAPASGAVAWVSFDTGSGGWHLQIDELDINVDVSDTTCETPEPRAF
jgi:hypothetical protein